ncbi:CinA family protein [Culicoidibacter larvae]|uniref:CinA family protein n=1 Tax=Culicoidibacter larvae TaxID=2579976 RepID=A0A5R8QAE1_9FIRM|nr:CinA family protein [Culicoidibacter larvae]TLG72561.1 CinA family protein [Culicoidibacter larvae]
MIKLLIDTLKKRSWRLAIVETSSGGLLSAEFIKQDGVSAIFAESMVAYDMDAKLKRLHVDEELIAAYGSVSVQTAESMARGMCKNTGADVVISITGISGPKGGTEVKPVGLTYICVLVDGVCSTKQYFLSGSRHSIMKQTVELAIQQTYDCIFSKEE